MSPTITAWIAQEKSSFDNFNDFVAIRLEDAIFHALAEKQKRDIAAKKSSSVTLPWGTYTADVKAVGEAGNITPTFEESKLFKKMLNDDGAVSRDLRQESFDPEYFQLFKEYVAYGYFNPDPTQETPAYEKGIRLTDDEAEYFLNGYLNVLVTIAKDKQRAGKTYRLEIDEGFPHGSFDFKYGDDDKDEEIKVTFIPHKAYKQYLKNDEVSSKAGEGAINLAAASLAPLMSRRAIFAKKPALKSRQKVNYSKMII